MPSFPTRRATWAFPGLRLRHRLNAPDRWDDVLVLQGASYFRALARGTVYGLSARALSLGTGGPGPEEFPPLHPDRGVRTTDACSSAV